MMHLLTNWLVIIDDVLTQDQCESIINASQSNLRQSSTLGKNIPGYRTSEDFFFDKNSAENQLVSKITHSLTCIDISYQEDLHVVHYDINQEYKEHYDFLAHLPDELKRGGDRIYSLIFYLNYNFTGGETYFPKLDIAIEPKIGRLAAWKNYIDGKPNYDSLHCGLPVKSGQKWIATKWVRESTFN